jgi:hypothetical protein
MYKSLGYFAVGRRFGFKEGKDRGGDVAQGDEVNSNWEAAGHDMPNKRI